MGILASGKRWRLNGEGKVIIKEKLPGDFIQNVAWVGQRELETVPYSV